MEKKIGDIENKILDVTGLVTAAVLHTKVSEVDNKDPDFSDLVTTVLLNKDMSEVEKKIPDVGGLVKKTDYYAKTLDIVQEYFITLDYNKFPNDVLNEKIKQNKLVNESNVSNLVSKILI